MMTLDIGTSDSICTRLAKRATNWSRGCIGCLAMVLGLASGVSFGGDPAVMNGSLPDEIKQILTKPRYDGAVWGLRVVDLDSGEVVYDLNSDRQLLIGSVRKLFSVGLALEALGPGYVFRTPVYAQGRIHHGRVLDGDLVLVASGDLAMGGRTNPDGTYAISNFDHNEANALGNAVLTAPDPLGGYEAIAAQVAASGIKRVMGDVIIDDRLFEPFNFRDEFELRPIFVNDDVVDVIMSPGRIGARADVDWRPHSAAFHVHSRLRTAPAGEAFELELDPELPDCIGAKRCAGTVSGSLPIDFVPPLTARFPLVRTFRIVEPANYARTVLIEALGRAGVSVNARAVAPNRVGRLPAPDAYLSWTKVAELVSLPYRDYAKHIMKVSYNIGADTSLLLFGLTKSASNMRGALAAERETLAREFDIQASTVHFIDGSGGGDTTATSPAVTKLLREMSRRSSFADYFDAQPRLGVDGSLSFVTDFEADPTLAGAKGQVHAKTGTFVKPTDRGPVLKTQALAGYIIAKSGRRFAFMLAVNDAGVISGINDVIPVFQDQGTIAAILWKLL